MDHISGINILTLTPKENKPSLDPKNLIINHLLYIYSLIFCNLYYFLLTFTTLPLVLASNLFGKYHTGVTSLLLVVTLFPNTFSPESVRDTPFR